MDEQNPGIFLLPLDCIKEIVYWARNYVDLLALVSTCHYFYKLKEVILNAKKHSLITCNVYHKDGIYYITSKKGDRRIRVVQDIHSKTEGKWVAYLNATNVENIKKLAFKESGGIRFVESIYNNDRDTWKVDQPGMCITITRYKRSAYRTASLEVVETSNRNDKVDLIKLYENSYKELIEGTPLELMFGTLLKSSASLIACLARI